MDALIELERARLAPDWEDVAAGRASADDVAQRVRARGVCSEEEISRARELFEPLSTDFEAALVERLIPTATVPTSHRDAIGIERDPAFWRRPVVLGTAVAALAAAAIAIVWMRPSETPRTEAKIAMAGPAIPSHELMLTGVADVRGSGDSNVSVPAGGSLRVALRPATRYNFTPIVWACLAHDGQSRPITIATDRVVPGETISAAVAIPADLTPGAWELVTMVASRAVPQAERSCDVAEASDLQVRRGSFRVTAPR
ncbi:MAG TPA: hypothetical protein VG755_22115 [Nannocystaceae bacterium]|nr:hypothetical protein [Nannocystaceae bacterium]